MRQLLKLISLLAVTFFFVACSSNASESSSNDSNTGKCGGEMKCGAGKCGGGQ